ncbi:hypothetical protein [Rhizobium mesosinicum]|uniref:Transmembrane protein n=1 Tax=Rhizobium mesosinicum TaxID=335017 RepID=A0ABS7GPY1_9HYPH|nr:hypothetical protein [Rhizobium mesosinicum]MBW9051415.1 hypothetical protein [Rhizobium mesosinicum]
MTRLQPLTLVDRMSLITLMVLTTATILMAAEAHAFCSVFCIHGDRTPETDICSGR